MNIVFYTSGITGSGRLVRGISIGTALARKGIICDFTILSSSPFGRLADDLNINHIEIPIESEDQLSKGKFQKSMEPFLGEGPDQQINPLILRNRNEILTRKEALRELSLSRKKNCLLAYNGHPGDFERVEKKYSYLETEGYHIVSTTNYKGGIFPVIDYFNAFDLIVCGASYNSFWEVIYFKKKGIFVPTKTRFVDGERLIRQFSNYSFKENGADQLVKIMINL